MCIKEWSPNRHRRALTCFAAASARFDACFERGGLAGGWNLTSKPANELAGGGGTDRGSTPYARGNAGEERRSILGAPPPRVAGHRCHVEARTRDDSGIAPTPSRRPDVLNGRVEGRGLPRVGGTGDSREVISGMGLKDVSSGEEARDAQSLGPIWGPIT